jgi:hypothetical protein
MKEGVLNVGDSRKFYKTHKSLLADRTIKDELS